MQNFHHSGICPIRDIIARISTKWAMLVLTTLHTNGVMRFNDIQKSIGEISQRMLTVTLRLFRNRRTDKTHRLSGSSPSRGI